MNLILLFEENFIGDNTVEIRGERAKHIIGIHKPLPGKEFTVGLLNGKIGKGKLLKTEENTVKMEINLTENPPAQAPVTLLVALPRPKTLKKVLQASTSIGVKKIIFFESWKVDKSYWKALSWKMMKSRQIACLGLSRQKTR